MQGQRERDQTTGQAPQNQSPQNERERGAKGKDAQGKDMQKDRGQDRGQLQRDQNQRDKNQTQREQRGRDQTTGQEQREQAPTQTQRDQRDQMQGQAPQRQQGQPGAAQQGQAGGNVTLTTEQRTHIRQTILVGGNAPRVSSVNFPITVGTAVPASVRVVEVPTVLIEVHPEWRGYMYFVVGDEIIVVDRGNRIIAVLAV
jgi:hypothetical protein